VSIRKMVERDLPEVMKVDSDAWSKWRLESSGKREKLVPRPVSLLRMYLDSDPDGSVVALDNGKVAGYGFARRFGTLGYVGPVAVDPASQGKGFGKRLTEACTDYLARAGVETIGLETMPHAPKNLGLYAKLGFKTDGLSFSMEKKPPSKVLLPTGVGSEGIEIVKADSEDAISRIGDVCKQALHGMDYSKEAYYVRKFDLGMVLLINFHEQCVGFAICYTFRTPTQKVGMFRVKFSAMLPEYCRSPYVDAFVDSWESWALKLGLTGVGARFYTKNERTLDILLSHGYAVASSHVKMHKGRFPLDDIATLHIEQWGG